MDQADHADPLDGHLADLQLVRILDHAIHRRADIGSREVQPGLVDRGLRLSDLRLLARSDRGVRVRGASTRIGELSLGRTHVVVSGVEIGAGGEALLEQRLLSSERVLLDLQVRLGARDVASGAGSRRPKHLRLQLGIGQCRLRLLERDLIGLRVDSEEKIALLHMRAVADVDRDHLSVHLRADRNDVLLDLRIVGRDAAAARHVIIETADDQQRRDDQHHDRLRPVAAATDAQALARRLFRGFGRGHRCSLHFIHWFDALLIGAVRHVFSRTRASTCRAISNVSGQSRQTPQRSSRRPRSAVSR